MRLVDLLDQSSALLGAEALSGDSYSSESCRLEPVAPMGHGHARHSAGTSHGTGFYDLDNNLFLSYQGVVNASYHLAKILRQKGVKAQDVVATYVPNSVLAYCCIFAISRIGAVWQPLNVRNALDANLKLIEKSGASLVFLDQSIVVKYPELSEILGGNKSILLDGEHVAGLSFTTLAQKPASSSDLIPEAPIADADETVIALFATGGTTGESKLAEWDGFTWSTMTDIQQQLMPEPDIPSCYLVSAPMSHAAGVASFAPIRQGATILVMNGMVPNRLLAVIEAYAVTHLFLPPTAIYMLLADSNIKHHDYSSLRYFWYAAAPMSVEKLKEAIAIFGSVMIQTYGQAEAPMLCTFLSIQDHLLALESGNHSILRSCGKVAPQVELAILDEAGNKLPSGQEGEVAVKGNLLMKKYYQNPEATAAIREADGWQRTGDIGVVDNDGYLAIVDRKRDMIISGGFNVYPSEVEQLIWGFPAIKDCAVIGIPDEKWGEQVTAIVELKDPTCVVREQEIIQYCKDKLGSVKAPKQVFFWDELPRSSVGKVLKKEIRKIFWDKKNQNI